MSGGRLYAMLGKKGGVLSLSGKAIGVLGAPPLTEEAITGAMLTATVQLRAWAVLAAPGEFPRRTAECWAIIGAGTQDERMENIAMYEAGELRAVVALRQILDLKPGAEPLAVPIQLIVGPSA